MDTEEAQFIDRLRQAAREHGAVADLLDVVERGIMIDELGNKDVVAENDDLRMLELAQNAAAFVRLDRANGG